MNESQSPEDEIPLPSEPILSEEETANQLRADQFRQNKFLMEYVEEKLKAARELHAMQLAAISALSLSNTRHSLLEVKDCHEDYKPTAFNDVVKAIEREIEWRETAEQLYLALANDGITTDNPMSQLARAAALDKYREVSEPK